MGKFAVIGLGRFGFHVAKALYEEGNDVIAIDVDKARIHAIDPYCSHAIVIDATDKESLKALGLEDVDSVIVSTGSKISMSILICLYLQEMGVKKIIVKAMDEDHAKILKKMGVTQIIHPEKDMALKVARALTTPNILDFIPLAEDFTLVQMGPPHSFIGKSLKELGLRTKFNVHVIAIEELVPQNFVLVPPADFIIKDSDVLIILGKAGDIKKIQAVK